MHCGRWVAIDLDPGLRGSMDLWIKHEGGVRRAAGIELKRTWIRALLPDQLLRGGWLTSAFDVIANSNIHMGARRTRTRDFPPLT